MKCPVAGVRMDSAEGLGNLLLQIKAAVSEGILQQYKPRGAVMALDDIEMLNPGGPWPDYIEAYFFDPVSGRKYRLIAETYHGSVAKWEQIQTC